MISNFVNTNYLFLALVCLSACTSSTSNPSNDSMATQAPLSVSWEVLSNIDIPNSFTSELILTNTSQDTLPAQDWSLYFNFIRLIENHSNTERAEIHHINGDFYQLSPSSALAPQEEWTFTIQANAWAIKESDAPSGFYMVLDEGTEQEQIVPVTQLTVLPFINEHQTSRMASDAMPVPTPESTYEDNQRLRLLPVEEIPPVLPTPTQATYSSETFTLSAETAIYYQEGLENEATFLTEALAQVLETPPPSHPRGTSDGPGIALQAAIEPTLEEEAYTLTITAENVTISGGSPQGVFYGMQTLRALIPPEGYTTPTSSVDLPAVSIQDTPRFPYRGMHLDVSRNFHTIESVKKLLDVMAFYKLNKFHFHLTDDEGWRIEIPGLPELTEIGGRRGHTVDELDHMIPSLGSGPFVGKLPGSGYYTRDEYIDLLRYAKARHIEVIPEIDVPGHARAAIIAMKARHQALSNQGKHNEAAQYLLSHPEDTSIYQSVQLWNDNVIDVCLPSTYTFLEKVFDEVRLMHNEAGMPLTVLHTGGDEVPHGVWTGSPACSLVDSDNLHDYFLENVHQLLDKHNIRVAGWEEIALTESADAPKTPNPAFVPYAFQAYVWNNVWGWGMEDMAYQLANAGYPVVLSNATNLYFDMSYNKSPKETGYYWASFVNTYKAFSLTPSDIFKSVETDNLGNPVDTKTRYPNRVRLTAEGQQNILGLQGQLWTERAPDAESMEYLIFPKLLGLAERAWAQQPEWATIEDDTIRRAQLAQAWNQFANQLGHRELPRLDGLNGGLAYRIPPPGARIIQGMLYANTSFPGLDIRYTLDGTLPTLQSPLYTGPMEVATQITLQTFSPMGHHSQPITLHP